LSRASSRRRGVHAIDHDVGGRAVWPRNGTGDHPDEKRSGGNVVVERIEDVGDQPPAPIRIVEHRRARIATVVLPVGSQEHIAPHRQQTSGVDGWSGAQDLDGMLGPGATPGRNDEQCRLVLEQPAAHRQADHPGAA
jgi:hypothetical protein